jgi:hypothetical protein
MKVPRRARIIREDITTTRAEPEWGLPKRLELSRRALIIPQQKNLFCCMLFGGLWQRIWAAGTRIHKPEIDYTIHK